MSEKDFAIGSVGIPTGAIVSKKPCYLVTLSDPIGKAKTIKFISLDKPDSLNGFITSKGFYSDESEDFLIKNFIELISLTPKENILEMMFPWHRIISIRSLVFNANKLSTLIK